MVGLWEPRKTLSLPKGTPSEDLTRDQLAYRVNCTPSPSATCKNLKREKRLREGESHESVTVTSSDMPVIQIIDICDISAY